MAKKFLFVFLFLLLIGYFAMVLTKGAYLDTIKASIADMWEKPLRFNSGELEVKTDHDDYRLGEEIGITVKNLLNDTMRVHVGSATPIATIDFVQRKYTDGSWKREDIQCQYPNCTYVTDSPYPLAAGESRAFRWKPLFFVNGTTETKEVDPGQYRFVIRYQVRATPGQETWEWHRTTSNEFLIR